MEKQKETYQRLEKMYSVAKFEKRKEEDERFVKEQAKHMGKFLAPVKMDIFAIACATLSIFYVLYT